MIFNMGAGGGGETLYKFESHPTSSTNIWMYRVPVTNYSDLTEDEIFDAKFYWYLNGWSGVIGVIGRAPSYGYNVMTQNINNVNYITYSMQFSGQPTTSDWLVAKTPFNISGTWVPSM